MKRMPDPVVPVPLVPASVARRHGEAGEPGAEELVGRIGVTSAARGRRRSWVVACVVWTSASVAAMACSSSSPGNALGSGGRAATGGAGTGTGGVGSGGAGSGGTGTGGAASGGAGSGGTASGGASSGGTGSGGVGSGGSGGTGGAASGGTGTGGGVGSGGAATGGAASGGRGAGGAGAGGKATGGTTSTGGAGGASSAGCPADATFCSGFESTEFPTGATYVTYQGSSATGAGWTNAFAVDTSVYRNGRSSLRVRSKKEPSGPTDAYRMLSVPAPGPAFWAHFYIRSDIELGTAERVHNEFGAAAGSLDPNEPTSLEFAEDRSVAFNAHDDVRRPDGFSFDKPYLLPPNTWYCVELGFDSATRHQMMYVDGMKRIDAADFPAADQIKSPFAVYNFGLREYHGFEGTIWLDDMIVSKTRIPCPAP
jgi:hypothetical protein